MKKIFSKLWQPISALIYERKLTKKWCASFGVKPRWYKTTEQLKKECRATLNGQSSGAAWFGD